MSTSEDPIPIDAMEEEPIELADMSRPTPDGRSSMIRTFGQPKRHDEKWQRSPNVTGQGAIHVKTFFAKLREDAINYMDEQINEWLDQHPEYEVKFVTSSVGELMGKLKEPALFISVWV